MQKYIINKKINIVEQSSFLHIDSLVNKKFINNTKIINNDKLRFFLNAFSENEIPIQIHAYGINCIQYHRGIIKNIIDYGPWLNVIDNMVNNSTPKKIITFFSEIYYFLKIKKKPIQYQSKKYF